MNVIKVRGVIIGEEIKGEANKRLTVLTKDLGKIYIHARGAKKLKSPFFAGTQLFSYSDFHVYEGCNFYSLTQVDMIRSFHALASDLEKISEAYYMAELLQKTCFLGEEHNDILKLFLNTLLTLEKNSPSPTLISRIFEIKFLELSGFLSPLHCAICGGENLLSFYLHHGECFCQNHLPKHTNAQIIPISTGIQQTFLHVLSHEHKAIFQFTLSEALEKQLFHILHALLRVHMDIDLKSRSFGISLGLGGM